MDFDLEEKVLQAKAKMDGPARLIEQQPQSVVSSVKEESETAEASGDVAANLSSVPGTRVKVEAAESAESAGSTGGGGVGGQGVPAPGPGPSLPPITRVPSPDGRAESSESSSGSEEILPDRARALPLEKVDVGADFHEDDKADVLTLHHLHTDPLELDEPVVEERKERSTRLRRTVTRQPTHSEDSCDDYSSSEEEEMRKTIMIGSAYQAVVPEGFSKYGESRPYKYADKLLWDPKGMSNDEIEQYLQSSHEITDSGAEGIDVLPMGAHTRDDEQSLFLLMQCNYNIEEALKKHRVNPAPPPNPSSLWTDEECRNFENGLLTYGKDFHTIQSQKVRTRSVSEIVQFYYLWKKTERHDIFANKMRPDKKKYMLHPGVTLVVYELLDKENQKESVSKDLLTA